MSYIGPGQVNECLACERAYTTSVALESQVPREYATTYCSKECYEVYEAALVAGAAEGATLALDTGVDVAGTIRRVVGNYNLKLKGD